MALKCSDYFQVSSLLLVPGIHVRFSSITNVTKVYVVPRVAICTYQVGYTQSFRAVHLLLNIAGNTSNRAWMIGGRVIFLL